jgi:hypothetical protein
MKKALFFIVALASVAIDCTKSEVIKAPGRGREIKFDTYTGKTPVTKAESVDLDYLKRALENQGGVQVYAFLHNYIEPTTQVPEGEEVYKGNDNYVDVSGIPTNSAYMDKTLKWVEAEADASSHWDYPGVVYWPDYSKRRTLAFAAYALNVKDNIVWDEDPNVAYNEKSGHPEGQSYTKFTYIVPDAVKDQKDVLVTPFLPNQGLDENANAQAVQLNLKHLLSRVGFQVVANQDGDVQIDIKEITLYGNFPTQGKVNLKGSGVIDPITTEDDANAKYVTKYDFFPTANHFVTTSSVNPVDIYENTIHTTETDIATGEVITKEETNSDNSNRFMMIMPSTQATTGTTDAEGNVTFAEGVLPGAYIEVKYQLTDADEQIARVSLDGWKFEAGRSYTFRFKVSTLSIEFEVNVDSWLEHFEEKDENGNLANGDGTFTLMPIA